ncbi:transmembrane protein 17A isoform X2 [Pygocentrus nattereri]|uniref:transmembrane protein 17A isoform X2 n=1 Tax=Pygocentrus nattereri TaxID=42514 RepID=UPI00189134FB|nr:transmembrane protein 17A isoform X2 [Pygocentrus nattereri]
MPVFYTPIPQNLRVGLAHASSSVFINNRTRDSGDLREHSVEDEVCSEVSSNLPLQMLLYFNMFFFPFWWISEVVMLDLKVPELAGFWLISFLFQLPILLFFLSDEGLMILPLERAVHSLYLAFLLGEVCASFVALRVMTRKLALQFHLRQFGLHATDTLSVFGARSVLPLLPVRDIQPQ